MIGQNMRSLVLSKAFDAEKTKKELQDQFTNAWEKQKEKAAEAAAKADAAKIQRQKEMGKALAAKAKAVELQAMKDLAATEIKRAEKWSQVGKAQAADVFKKAEEHKERAMKVMEMMQREAAAQVAQRKKNMSVLDPRNLSKGSMATKSAIGYQAIAGTALLVG